jgi:hypothetical protein
VAETGARVAETGARAAGAWAGRALITSRARAPDGAPAA